MGAVFLGFSGVSSILAAIGRQHAAIQTGILDMQWLFRRFFDRLTARLVVLVSARLDGQMDIELSECRAEMLRAADEYERDSFTGSKDVAARLRERAERLGEERTGPGETIAVLVGYLRTEDLRTETQTGEADALRSLTAERLPSPPEKRGRPPKSEQA